MGLPPSVESPSEAPPVLDALLIKKERDIAVRQHDVMPTLVPVTSGKTMSVIVTEEASKPFLSRYQEIDLDRLIKRRYSVCLGISAPCLVCWLFTIRCLSCLCHHHFSNGHLHHLPLVLRHLCYPFVCLYLSGWMIFWASPLWIRHPRCAGSGRGFGLWTDSASRVMRNLRRNLTGISS